MNSGVVSGSLEATDLAQSDSWDQVCIKSHVKKPLAPMHFMFLQLLRGLKEAGTFSAIEFTSTVLSLCGTLRFSLSQESVS